MNNKKIPIESLLLGRISAVDVIAITAGTNGMGEFFRKFTFGKDPRYSSRYVSNAVSRLKRKGYIQFVVRGARTYVELTAQGKERLEKYQSQSLLANRPKNWDGKWRLVMFDISEKARSTRVSVRRELLRAGFVRLQDSVWVYPYDCEDYIALLKADRRIGKSLLYVVADKVEYDKPIKSLFALE